ncbi:hypothetical protein Y032_0054g2478 [Ancylostoma ceylanicum]|uniref:Unspecific monooxygenase n=2 Tax=Ancylostoma ceylanicum TaxID=53326 RepID=A0A016U733_9BILA|nr:hypothetical protein Y032_0054g2478 [Ancylostoma ceylanicum]
MIFLTILLAIFTYLYLSMWIKRRSLPPGPLPLPLIGNVHLLAYKMWIKKKDFTASMKDIVNDYGSVLTLWFGPVATVHICDYENTVDAMVKKGTMFVNRALPYLFETSRGGRGLLASSDFFWQEQRRFALHTLRSFGLGRNIMEERIMFEFEYTCEELEKQMENGRLSIQPNHMFELLIGNIINRMLFTDRFEKEEEKKFFALKSKLDNIFDTFEPYDVLINGWTINIPLFRRRAEALLKPQNDLLDFLNEQVQKRKKAIADGIHVLEGDGGDFVDAFLIQMEKDEKSGKASSFDEESLCHTLLDLWAAGQETTATTLTWAFAYLLLHDSVKARVTEELHHVTRGSRTLSLSDKGDTPYYNAVLTEIHRCAAIFPMNLSRKAKEDTEVGGYKIPKGTSVTAQVSLVMSDDQFFKDSVRFDPNRYLNGEKIEQQVVPFGMGKRACLGEALARAELYLIIGNFLLRYSLTADPAHMPTMSGKSKVGIVRKATPYNIIFSRS